MARSSPGEGQGGVHHFDLRFIGFEYNPREKQHGREGDAIGHGRAKHAVGGNQQRPDNQKRYQADGGAGGTPTDTPAANEIVAQHTVASQGDDTDRKPYDHLSDASELRVEKPLCIEPLRNAEDNSHYHEQR